MKLIISQSVCVLFHKEIETTTYKKIATTTLLKGTVVVHLHQYVDSLLGGPHKSLVVWPFIMTQ